VCPPASSHVNAKPDNRGFARGGARAGWGSLLVLAGLLVLPAMALCQRHWDFRWVGAYGLAVNVLTYWVYAGDKRRAQTGGWRLAEARLHLLELLGGWPAAFLAQRRLRHKCSKGGYQLVFWLIVLLHQFAAGDSVQDWKLSRTALKAMANAAELRR
jgi:uncharacterized membrane protein YsdA (DUF1294 family)